MKKRYIGLIILSVIIGFIFFLTFQYSNLKPTITGYTVINSSSFSSSSDFSNGTFSNIFQLGDGSHMRLGFNLTIIGSLVDSDYLNGANSVSISGNYAYVTGFTNDSINIINITNKSNPTRIGSLVDSGYFDQARGVFVSGNYTYVVSQINDSINIINITDKTNPTRIGSLSIVTWLNGAYEVFVSGNYAYVVASNNDSINIINITNKSNPTRIGSLSDNTWLNNVKGIFVLEDYAYVVSQDNDSINIINITDKTNPIWISGISDSTWLSGADGVYVVGNYAYVVTFTNDSINIINVTNKSNPTRIGSLSDNTWLNTLIGISVSGNYAYITANTNDSINIIDISNKTNPTRISSLTSDYLNAARGISVSGNYAYVVAFINDSINIININQTYPSGSYESAVINSSYTTNAIWYEVSWNETETIGTNLSIQFRSCDDPTCSGESYGRFYETSPASLSLNFNQYFQFNISFKTSNTSYTPKLHSINVLFSDDLINPTATFTCSPASASLGATVTCTCSGSDVGVGINSSATSAVVTIDVTQTGTFIQSGCTVRDLVGNSATATGTYTVSLGGSSILGISITQTITQINSFTEIIPNSAAIITNFNANIGINKIQIQVNNIASNVRIEINKFPSKPEEVSTEATGEIYKYLQIESTNLKDKLDKVIITIQVEKSWASNNSLEKDQIVMSRFDNNSDIWNELGTVFLNEDDTFYFYEIELDSFSFFAISGKVVAEDIIDKTIVTDETKDNNRFLFFGLIGILMIFSVIFNIIRKRRK